MRGKTEYSKIFQKNIFFSSFSFTIFFLFEKSTFEIFSIFENNRSNLCQSRQSHQGTTLLFEPTIVMLTNCDFVSTWCGGPKCSYMWVTLCFDHFWQLVYCLLVQVHFCFLPPSASTSPFCHHGNCSNHASSCPIFEMLPIAWNYGPSPSKLFYCNIKESIAQKSRTDHN